MGLKSWWFRKASAGGALARALAVAYRTLKTQDPTPSHYELLTAVLKQRQSILELVSHTKASRLNAIEAWLENSRQATLGDLAFRISMVESDNTAQSLGWENANLLRQVLEEEILGVLGSMPGGDFANRSGVADQPGLKATHPTHLRHLRFPSERSLGDLRARPRAAPAETGWEWFGAACGDVLVPLDVELELIMHVSLANDDTSRAFFASLDWDTISSLDYLAPADEDLKYLAGFADPRELTLGTDSLSDRGMVYLAGLKSLEVLCLWHSPGGGITDAGLRWLAGLACLKSLNIMATGVTGTGFSSLGSLPLELLRVRGTQFTDVGLQHLGKITALKGLDLSSTRITDAGLRHLAQLPALEWLFLEDTQTNGSGLLHLSGHANLSALYLSHSNVNDSGLQACANFARLKGLDLGNTGVTDAGLQYVTTMTALEWLCLTDTQVTDMGVQYLSELASLEALGLDGTQVTDACLAHLRDLTALTSLNLDRTDTTDNGLRYLSGFAHAVEELQLTGTRISDAGLQYLADLTGLRTLSIGANEITDAGLQYLAVLPALEELDLAETKVTDEGLRYLTHLVTLKELDLSGTQVSDAGIHDAFGAMPNLKVRR